MPPRIAGVTFGGSAVHLQGALDVLAAEEHFSALARQAQKARWRQAWARWADA